MQRGWDGNEHGMATAVSIRRCRRDEVVGPCGVVETVHVVRAEVDCIEEDGLVRNDIIEISGEVPAIVPDKDIIIVSCNVNGIVL